MFPNQGLRLRKETDNSSSKYSDYKSVEIAEPPTIEQQIHTGENVRPEYAYPRFKWAQSPSVPQAEAKGYESVTLTRFKEGERREGFIDKKEGNLDKKELSQKDLSQNLLVRKYDDYITPETVVNEHPVENGYFTPEIVARFKEERLNPQQDPILIGADKIPQSKQGYLVPLLPGSVSKLSDEFVDTVKSPLSEYAQEDLKRINSGFPKVMAEKKVDD